MGGGSVVVVAGASVVVVGAAVVLVVVWAGVVDVGAAVVVVEVLVVVVVAAQAPRDTTFVSRVTAPFSARSRPSMAAPVFIVTDAEARIVPAKSESVPMVAEDPTCQNTLHGLAPLVSTTLASLAVVRVLGIWKMNTASGLFWASRVTEPVSCADDANA